MTRHGKRSIPIEEILKEHKVLPYDSKGVKKLKTLGRGAFGKVFLAYNETLGFVAIKEMRIFGHCFMKFEF